MPPVLNMLKNWKKTSGGSWHTALHTLKVARHVGFLRVNISNTMSFSRES